MVYRSPNKNRQKVSVITLGCARNLVDSQKIVGHIQNKGGVVTPIDQADVAILNTCGFIEDAKQESLDAIVELIELKKQGKIQKVIVAGCLAQRYRNELLAEFKEIDALVGAQQLDRDAAPDEVSLTPGHYAYLKICESCYNNCAFCVIPSIKGVFRSRTKESILREVERLDERGVKEVNIIGQDITAYGMDLYRDKALAALLREMIPKLNSIEWIRLLYTFPSHITDDLISVIAQESKICKYLDIPFQHISDKILKRMNRKITKAQTYDLIAKIRKRIPDGCLRTALIVGLPGETDKDFEALVQFVREVRFEKLGVFMYSREEGVPAYAMSQQVPRRVKEERYERLMQEQQAISQSLQSRWEGQTVKVLIDQAHETEAGVYLGRTACDAPEVDGIVYAHVVADAKKKTPAVSVGDFARVKITHATEYDLIGEVI